MTCAQKRGSKKQLFAFSNGDAIVNRFNRFSLMVWCLAGCLSVPCSRSSKTDVQTWTRSIARTALLRRSCGRNVKLWKRILMVRHFRTVHAVSSWREPIDLGRLVLGVHFKLRCLARLMQLSQAPYGVWCVSMRLNAHPVWTIEYQKWRVQPGDGCFVFCNL